jgi:hypothetical protein
MHIHIEGIGGEVRCEGEERLNSCSRVEVREYIVRKEDMKRR